ncbi:MAG: hypothetical protein IPM82_23235 [Saprospiraceae bacterium]|nr:hypothetical protein [Saprospiraceae bacterium]
MLVIEHRIKFAGARWFAHGYARHSNIRPQSRNTTSFCSKFPFDRLSFKYLVPVLPDRQAGRGEVAPPVFFLALVITHPTQGLMLGISAFLNVYFGAACTVPEVWDMEWQETNMAAASMANVNWIFIGGDFW